MVATYLVAFVFQDAINICKIAFIVSFCKRKNTLTNVNNINATVPNSFCVLHLEFVVIARPTVIDQKVLQYTGMHDGIKLCLRNRPKKLNPDIGVIFVHAQFYMCPMFDMNRPRLCSESTCTNEQQDITWHLHAFNGCITQS